MSNNLNSYELSRQWFDFCFENPEKIKPKHTAIYFFAIEHCNRLGWKDKFGFPTQMAMDAIGIRSYNTYIKAFRDIVEWGFFDLIEKSKNQYSSNIIALSKFNKASDKSLDKAFQKHSTKHHESTQQSTDSINKQGNKGTKEPENTAPAREDSDLSLPEMIEESPTAKALSQIWFSYRREKAKDNPNLYNLTNQQQEMLQHQLSQWGLVKSKEIMRIAMQNGWTSLKEDYLPDDFGKETQNIEAPNAAAYTNDYTSFKN